MKIKSALLQILLAVVPLVVAAQTTSDILEHGIRIDKTNELRLKYENSVLKYKTVVARNSSYVSLDDSIYFLTSEKAVIYIVTLNPLNSSVGATISYTPDALSKAEDNALQSIITALKNPGGAGGGAAGPAPTFAAIKSDLDLLQTDLNSDNKKKIADLFTQLKAINFAQLLQAQATLNTVNTAIGTKTTAGLMYDYSGYQQLADKIKVNIASYTEPAGPGGATAHDQDLAKQVFTQQLAALNSTLSDQLKWVANLSNAYKMVNDAMNAGITSDGELVTEVTEVSVTSGKIANVSIAFNQDGLQLNATNDIVATDKKVLVTKVAKFRRFKRFVFEMASGIAYASLDYPTYGTSTNAAGQTVVASSGNQSFKRFNLTAMFNWNYYIPKSDIHPFFQIGIGANSTYPALFTGLGLRFNSETKTHFAISFGAASSWVPTLNKLKIGDTVTGTADITKDITYEFQWPVKPYLGLQYNF